MTQRLACISLTFALGVFAQSATAASNCTCRGNGSDVPEGQTICLKTSAGAKLARCERVLNNTSWTILEEDCPTAALPQLSTWLPVKS